MEIKASSFKLRANAPKGQKRFPISNNGKCREVSNVPESQCSSLGVIRTGGHYVYDNDSGTDDSVCGMSWGCIVVDDQYINRKSGGELIHWFKDGSIGIAHYGGKFKI